MARSDMQALSNYIQQTKYSKYDLITCEVSNQRTKSAECANESMLIGNRRCSLVAVARTEFYENPQSIILSC